MGSPREPQGSRTPGAGDPARAQRAWMVAVVQRDYGPPEVVGLAEIDRPRPGAGEVLVGVHAASVHPGDYFVLTGVPYIIRPVYGLRRPRHPVPGRDLAGAVVAVGGGVTRLGVGDEVFGWSATGTLAEYACAAEDHFAPKPANVTMEQAAAVATSGTAALQALRDVGRVQPGQGVLIIGASGGVGTFAVQIAKTLGAEVTGVCSSRNVELVRSLGADHVIDYAQTDPTRGGQRYDVILDNVEVQPLTDRRRVLAPTGILIANSGSGGRLLGTLGRWSGMRLRSLFTRQRLRPFSSRENLDDLVALKGLMGAGTITPVVERTYELSDAARALAHVGEGHTRGKVAISVRRPGEP